MVDVPRYRASRSDRRPPDRESSAERGPDASLLRLARIIGRDEVFQDIVRRAEVQPAPDADDALQGVPYEPYDEPPEFYDEPLVDPALVDPTAERSPRPAVSADPDWDDRDVREGRSVRAQRSANREQSAGPRQLGQALSELARLVGRIDSFLAAGSSRPRRSGPDGDALAFGRRAAGGRHRESDEVYAFDMPVPSRHDRLADDDSDPGLSLYVPRRKGRAAYVVASAEASDDCYRPPSRATPRDDQPRESWDPAGDSGYYIRPHRWWPPQATVAPRRYRSRVLTATAFLALTVTATVYGYRTWTDLGSSRPGPIAAEAAPMAATGEAADAPTDLGLRQAAPGVRSASSALLAPAVIVNGVPSPSRKFSAAENATAGTRPRRRDEDRTHRPSVRLGAPTGAITPVAN